MLTKGCVFIDTPTPPLQQPASSTNLHEITSAPPYSPDLAPTDYHPLLTLKSHLNGTNFKTKAKLKEEVVRYLRAAAREFYDMGMQKMIHGMRKCFDNN